MEGDIASAGNFVAAILEHAGMLAQSRILEDFRSFFRDAGALLYFIAAVGGLISVLMFGSFRAARYLIMGPALYWFLVGPTVDIEGVVAKLGGGTPRGLPGNVGLEDAKKDRDEALNKAGEKTSSNLKVAQGFWLFAKPINDFVEEFVDVMLSNEDGSDLAVASKVKGLEMIARSLPSNSETLNLIESEIIANCMDSYTAAMGAAENYVKNSITKGLKQKNGAKKRQTNIDAFESEKLIYLDSVKKSHITVNPLNTPTLFQFIEAEHAASVAAAANGAGAEGENQQGRSKYLKHLYDEEKKAPLEQISCEIAFNLMFEQVWALSALKLPPILRLSTGEFQNEKEYNQACKDLTRKLYDDAEGGMGASKDTDGECELQPGVALALFWNHLSRQDTFQRIAMRHSNFNDPLSPVVKPQVGVISNVSGLIKSKFGRLAVSEGVKTMTSALGGPILSTTVGAVTPAAQGLYNITVEQAPAGVLSFMPTLSASEEVDLPIYEMTRARQQIFSFAQQLPYFQGVVLYLVSLAYPFAALLVLLPGRAEAFINVPLMWLWAKSWDIGFAGVIILERVMYNLLPNWSVHPDLRGKEPWTFEKLPLVLGEGYNFSHAQGLAYHYVVLSMVMLSIPAIMALMTIKAKKALLANFTDASTAQARESGNRAAAGYSITASNERAQLLMQTSGFATQAPALSSGGLEGGMRGTVSFAGALPGMATKMLAQGASNLRSPNQLSAALKSMPALSKQMRESGLGKYKDLVNANANFESQYGAAHGELFGRFGIVQMHYDAAAASLDGSGARVSGGFETNNPMANAISAYNDLSKERLKTLIGMSEDLGAAEGAILGGLIENSVGLLTNENKKAAALSFVVQAAAETIARDEESNSRFSSVILQSMEDQLDKNLVGYDKSVAWARIWGLSPDRFSDENINEFVNSDQSQNGFTGQFLLGIYQRGNKFLEEDQTSKAENNQPSIGIPGGLSGYDGILMGFGGDRHVIQVNENELRSGIDFKATINEESFLEKNYSNVSGQAFFKAMGYGPSDHIFTEMQIRSEIDFFQSQPDLHKDRLSEAVRVTGALESFHLDFSSEEPREQVVELYQRAREIHAADEARGYTINFPSNLDELIERAPISAVEAINRWELNRESAAIGHGLILDANDTKGVIVNPDQLKNSFRK